MLELLSLSPSLPLFYTHTHTQPLSITHKQHTAHTPVHTKKPQAGMDYTRYCNAILKQKFPISMTLKLIQ